MKANGIAGYLLFEAGSGIPIGPEEKGGLRKADSRRAEEDLDTLFLQTPIAKVGLTKLTIPADDKILRKVRRSMNKKIFR